MKTAYSYAYLSPFCVNAYLYKPAISEWTTMTIEGKAKKEATYLEFEDATDKKKYKTLIKFAKKEGKPVPVKFLSFSFLWD